MATECHFQNLNCPRTDCCGKRSTRSLISPPAPLSTKSIASPCLLARTLGAGGDDCASGADGCSTIRITSAGLATDANDIFPGDRATTADRLGDVLVVSSAASSASNMMGSMSVNADSYESLSSELALKKIVQIEMRARCGMLPRHTPTSDDAPRTWSGGRVATRCLSRWIY